MVSPAASSVGAPGALGGATRLALDPGRRRLFLTARGKVLAVLDTSTGEPVAMVPLASEATALACDPASGRTYLTGAGGELSVIQGDAAGRFAVANTLPLQAGPCALVLDERTHLLYVPTAGPANGQTFQIQVVGPS